MFQSLLIILHSRLQLIGILVHGADIIVSISEPRLLIDGHLEIADGLVMTFQITVDQTHVVIFHGPGRRGTQGLLQVTHGVLIISRTGLHFTQAVGGHVIR